MDSQEAQALVQRLVLNPHDEAAIRSAHQAGQRDPRAYASLLEKVANATGDGPIAAHWLVEAANVWESLRDVSNMVRTLELAFERDLAHSVAAERLLEYYRRQHDHQAFLRILEQKANALSSLAASDGTARYQAAALYEEAGRTLSDQLGDRDGAIARYRKALEADERSQYAIYALRELYKAAGQYAEALPYFDLEQQLVTDPARKFDLYLDEVELRRHLGDQTGVIASLKAAIAINPADTGAQAHLATAVLERHRSGFPVPAADRQQAGALFVQLAERVPEHAFVYSLCGLELNPAQDRGLQLAIYYGEQLGRMAEVAPFAAGYLEANPTGVMAADARRVAGNAKPLPPPLPAGPEQLAQRPFASAAFPERPVMAAPAATSELDDLLERATALAQKNRRNEAAKLFRKMLELDPTQPEALEFLQAYLRRTRQFAELREILIRAADGEAPPEERLGWLKEAASVSEAQLRDLNGAIDAWQRIVQRDLEEGAAEQLKRLLERAGRWDDLAALLQQEASLEHDAEVRIVIEKNLAKLHEIRRNDPVASGEAWARIAELAPGDETAIDAAVEMFEKGGRSDLAAQVISANAGAVEDNELRANFNTKLGTLRRALGDHFGAGEAFGEAALALSNIELWQAAEQSYLEAEDWDQAAQAAEERAQLMGTGEEQAAVYAQVADYRARAGDLEGALLRLERATELDPAREAYSESYETMLLGLGRQDDLPAFLLHRAEHLAGDGRRALRVTLRKRAAQLQRERFGDLDAARESLELVLLDGDDPEALGLLIEDSVNRSQFADAVSHLRKLAPVVSREQRAAVMLREARLRAQELDDLEGAAERYERLLLEVDESNRDALVELVALEERRENWPRCAEVLERQLSVAEPDQKVELALKLAELYENQLQNLERAMGTLGLIHRLDPDDFDAVQRLADLAERTGRWDEFAGYYDKLISIEGDDAEISEMTQKLAGVLHVKLKRSAEALERLGRVADQGDGPCREAFIDLADSLGEPLRVADKLVTWYGDGSPTEQRTTMLHSAFDRYLEGGRDEQAARVAKILTRSRSADERIAEPLERVAKELRDLDALAIAYQLMVAPLSGTSRAVELVRQAEVLVEVGVPASDAVQHGELGLAGVEPDAVEPLLGRLSQLATTDDNVIALYERQVTRCKKAEDRLRALARAAAVAVEHGSPEKARSFFDLALGGSVTEEALGELRASARATDDERGGTTLRRTLAESLAEAGRGARDGGRSRAAMLRLAAELAARELNDIDQAFGWLSQSLVAYVDDETLNQLEALATEARDLTRMEGVLSHALEQVFDGPLVRKLLRRRALLRRQMLRDARGAAEDFKRLYDLAPHDADITEALVQLYEGLADHRSLVQLYEDQLLRSRDSSARGELSRKIALLWRDQLGDPREAADAWRRVLRICGDDAEAKEELAKAKAALLEQRRTGAPPEAAPHSPSAGEGEETASDPADDRNATISAAGEQPTEADHVHEQAPHEEADAQELEADALEEIDTISEVGHEVRLGGGKSAPPPLPRRSARPATGAPTESGSGVLVPKGSAQDD